MIVATLAVVRRRGLALLGGGLLVAACLGVQAIPTAGMGQAGRLAGGAPATAGSLTTVDWANATYTTACLASKPRPIAAHGGIGFDSGVHLQVYSPLYADLTGDGRPEAIIPYSCTGADFGGVRAFIYTGSAAAPRLLGDLPGALPGVGQSFASIHTFALPALTVLPSSRVLEIDGVGYSARAIHTCPDLRISARYTVAAGRLVHAGATVQHASGCLSL